MDQPDALHSACEECDLWLKTNVNEDVEVLQIMKQHHVHMLNPETNEREPLMACRRKDNPKLCKSDVPRSRWLVHEAGILC